MDVSSEIEKRAANLAAWSLAAALVIAIPFYQTVGEYEMLGFKYWGGDDVNRMEVIRNFALIVGGFLGLWLAWRRIVLMDQQTEVALQDSKQKEMDHVAARFENAIALLESDHEMSRVAGINAVRDLALKNKEDYLRQASDLIAAFLRSKSPVSDEMVSPSPDVGEAFNTIGQFLRSAKEVNSTESALALAVNLQNVAFDGAVMQFWDFQQVSCVGATFKNTNLVACNLGGGSMQQGMSFMGAWFNGCTFSITFVDADFSGCNFLSCNFSEAQFSSCNFAGSRMLMPPVIDRATRTQIGPPAHREIFSQCLLDGAELGVVSLVGEAEKSSFLPEDFSQCYITDPNFAPRGMNYNDPQLQTVVSPDPDTAHLFHVDFRFVEGAGEDAPTQAE